MKLTPKVFVKFGYTEGCEGCSRASAGNMEPRAHTEECRQRLTEAMTNDPERQEWLKRDDRRTTIRLSEELEKANA